MTTFQLLALGFLVVTVLAAYGKELLPVIRRYLPARTPAVRPVPVPVAPTPTATNCVNDMITVADMRDRLRALGCTEGVEACTYLLKVLVEFKYPQG